MRIASSPRKTLGSWGRVSGSARTRVSVIEHVPVRAHRARPLAASAARAGSGPKTATILTDRGAGKRVAMIGHFPFSERLEPTCGELWIFERGAGRSGGDLGGEMMEELLPQADVVGVTSTTIINRTLPGILDLVRPDAFVLLLGPSTPLTPGLFDHGIDLLCGTVIVDAAAVRRAVEQGAVTSQIKGVRRLCLWPE